MKTSLDAIDMTLTLLALSSLSATIALHWAHRKSVRARAAHGSFTPAISILKPLCGVDEGLYENLTSFARQEYPEYELVLAVADARDPALAIVREVCAAYPDAPIQVIVHGEHAFAQNPKVISLIHMLRAARYDYVLVSDSNVRASPEYLARTIAEMDDPTVGLVSNLIVGAGEESVGAQCESLHLHTFVSGGVCMADVASLPCVVGKSMLMRKDELMALGGFESLRTILAEDYVLGQRYHEAGFRVVLSHHPIATYHRSLPLRRFLSRHLRWAQLRRRCAPLPFCSEPLLYATPWLVAPLLIADTQGALLCALALCARIGNDGWMARRVSGRWPSLRALALLPFKDTLLLAIWCTAALRSSVTWRGHVLRIGAGSQLMLAPPTRVAELRSRLTAALQ